MRSGPPDETALTPQVLGAEQQESRARFPFPSDEEACATNRGTSFHRPQLAGRQRPTALIIAGLSPAAMGFVAMQPIFWTLPTEYMTGYAAAAGIGLINSLGNLGGFLAPNMRDYFKETIGGNAGLYSLAVAAVVGAVLFLLTAVFKKANEIEAGHLQEVDAAYTRH